MRRTPSQVAHKTVEVTLRGRVRGSALAGVCFARQPCPWSTGAGGRSDPTLPWSGASWDSSGRLAVSERVGETRTTSRANPGGPVSPENLSFLTPAHWLAGRGERRHDVAGSAMPSQRVRCERPVVSGWTTCSQTGTASCSGRSALPEVKQRDSAPIRGGSADGPLELLQAVLPPRDEPGVDVGGPSTELGQPLVDDGDLRLSVAPRP